MFLKSHCDEPFSLSYVDFVAVATIYYMCAAFFLFFNRSFSLPCRLLTAMSVLVLTTFMLNFPTRFFILWKSLDISTLIHFVSIVVLGWSNNVVCWLLHIRFCFRLISFSIVVFLYSFFSAVSRTYTFLCQILPQLEVQKRICAEPVYDRIIRCHFLCYGMC